jgi:hypothetical protein
MFLLKTSNYHPRRFYPDFEVLATEYGRVSTEMAQKTSAVTTTSLYG